MKTNPTDSINYIPASSQYAPEFGLTKREYFSVHLMSAMLSNPGININYVKFAVDAIKCTDALIEELNK